MEKLSKKERNKLLRCIKRASGTAQYALDAKMTDEQLTELSKHLDILSLIKDANNYNRHHQGLNTQKVNEELTATKTALMETKEKLDEFLNIKNSEILKVGRWLMDTLSLTGSDREQALLRRELIHKEDYNHRISDMRDTIRTINSSGKQITEGAEETIKELEKRIDTLRDQMSNVQKYVLNNYGAKHWKTIQDTFDIQ